MITFGLLFWEFDRGGPARRREPNPPPRDFQSPQDENPTFAEPDWHPRLVDDVYVSFTTLILRTKEQSPLLTAASIIGMLWVCSGAVGVIERCLPPLLARPSHGVVRGKLRNLGLAAVVTVVVMLMVAVATVGTNLVGRLHVNMTAVRVAVSLTSLVLTTLLCGTVFRALAGEALKWSAAWAGGMLVLVSILIGAKLGGVIGALLAIPVAARSRSWRGICGSKRHQDATSEVPAEPAA